MKIELKLSDTQAKSLESIELQEYPVRNGDAVRSFDWILRCAQAGIYNCYEEGSPRRVEMEKLCEVLRFQLRNQAPDLYDESGKII